MENIRLHAVIQECGSEQLLCSPDLTSSDFYLCPKMEKELSALHFVMMMTSSQTSVDMQVAATLKYECDRTSKVESLFLWP